MALVRPFEPEVFAAVAGALAVNTAVLWIFARLSGADRDFRAFARDAMESFGALTMQGWKHSQFKSKSKRNRTTRTFQDFTFGPRPGP